MKKTPENTFVLIDGNAIIHRAYHAIPPLNTKEGQVVNAVYGFGSILIRVLKELSPTHMVVTFDLPGGTFRDEIYEDYKANRKKADDDLYDQIPLIHDLVEAFNIPIVEVEGFEADDCIGTLAAKVEKGSSDTRVIIVTGDKDTFQLIDDNVTVHTMRKGISDIVHYDRDAVMDRYGGLTPEQIIDLKAIMGDASDNIKGVKGIGEKGAIVLLSQFKTLDGIYEAIDAGDPAIKGAALKKLIADKENAYMSQELATIRLDVPIKESFKDFKRKPVNEEVLLKMLQEFEFTSLLNRIPGMKNKVKVAPRKQVKVVDVTAESLNQVIEQIGKNDSVAVVVLASDKCFLDAKIIGVALVDKENSWYVPAKLKGWKKVLQTNARYLGVDTKETIKQLVQNGVEPPENFFDISLGSYLLHSESRAHDLTALALKYLGEKIDTDAKQESLFGKSSAQLANEAQAIYTITKHIDKEMKRVEVVGLYEKIDGPLVRVLANMEMEGVALDSSVLSEIAKRIDARLEDLTVKIHKAAGKDFNINSSTQLREVLFIEMGLPTEGIKKGKTGYSTAAQELEKLRDFDPIIAHIEEYRELMKLKTTYVDVLPTLAHKSTGRIHTTFNQTVAATGRLSSSDPNLQNIPIRTEEGRKIREAFVAEKGNVLVAADYSQIELRIVASLAQDKTMIEVFNAGEDIHTTTAAKIHGVSVDNVTKEMRRSAKEVNFGVLYGMGAFGLAQRTGISRGEAQEFIDKYFEAFSGVKKYIDETLALAKKNGYVETLFGRRRYVPELNSPNFQLRAAGERMAVNHPIQGTAADLIKLAMIELDKDSNVRMLLQVHDELIFEVKKSEADALVKKVKKVMEGVMELRVPIIVHAGVGSSWGSAK